MCSVSAGAGLDGWKPHRCLKKERQLNRMQARHDRPAKPVQQAVVTIWQCCQFRGSYLLEQILEGWGEVP